MIVLKNQNKAKIKQWHDPNCPYQIDFIIHKPSLFSAHESQDSLTLAYGYIDQETNGLTPAHFICKKIVKHGVYKGLNACYGSFILIHSNKKTHEVILANDALGDFALHYTRNKTYFCVSDLPSALLTQHNSQINRARVVDFFALTQPANNGSFFKNITQLNPGHYVRYKNDELVHKRYYQPPSRVDFKQLSLPELALKYQNLLKQAINWQTRNQDKVSIMMSGGMDSTFVAANCLSLNKQVNAFSYVFPEFKEADESTWIASMSELGIVGHSFAGENFWPLKGRWQTSLNAPVSNPYRLLKNEIYHQVAENNIQTLLTGVYADHLYVAHLYWLVDLIKQHPLTGLKSLALLLKSKGVYAALRHVSPSKWSRKVKSNPFWLSKQAHKTFNQRKLKVFSHPHPQQVNLVYGIDTAQSVWLDNEYTNKYGITIRHPYRDRRVVEFITSIPAWLIGNSQDSKQFVHKSAQNLLPSQIIKRKKVTSLKPLFIKGVLQKELATVRFLLLHKESCWHEFIDKNIILSLLDNPRHQFPELHYVLLWKCISFEMWLKKIKNQTNFSNS